VPWGLSPRNKLLNYNPLREGIFYYFWKNLPGKINSMEAKTELRIFVLEDNKTEGMLLKLCLGSLKNVIITNYLTGTDLLNDLHENPEIVIADLMLPDIPGFDLVKSIKEYNAEIEVVVVSAQRDIELVARLQELGIFNYIVKSEGCIEYLQKVIENLLIIHEINQKARLTE
jgi:DNA-binding NtrC family response regulator